MCLFVDICTCMQVPTEATRGHPIPPKQEFTDGWELPNVSARD